MTLLHHGAVAPGPSPDVDAAPSGWAPSIGAAIGAVLLIANVPLWAASYHGHHRAALEAVTALVTACLMVPLVARWPLTRTRVSWTAGLWLIFGAATAIIGFGMSAVAAVPALIGVGVGWGTRSAAIARPRAPGNL